MIWLLLFACAGGPLETRSPVMDTDVDEADADTDSDTDSDTDADTDTDTDADTDSDTDADTDTDTDTDTASSGACGADMVEIDDGSWSFCIDRYEAALDGYSPYEIPDGTETAINGYDLVPQGYISGTDAASACSNAGKRLCEPDEWMRACQGPSGTTWPYGNSHQSGACNDTFDGHPVVNLYGSNTDWSPGQMNDPAVNQQADSLDPSGANPSCVTAEGVYDMHGNLHEWVDDPNGTFKGGFYADASINGDGCTYQTTAHSVGYHDYSTGFRCCADL